MDAYDVIIIGTGAGGGTLARHLAPRASASCCSSAATGCRASRRTGRTRTCSWTTATSRPDTWYDASGKPFQPGVHYFVGGATKLYGAALYRLRKEDFGELQPPRRISPAWPISYDELEPYYTLAEQLYQVHGARGEDPTEPPASAPYPHPGRVARAADPAARRRPRGGRLPAVPRAVRGHARRVEHAVRDLHPLCDLRRLPVPRAREVRRRGARRAAGARAPERDAPDEREGRQARDERRRAPPSPRWSSSTTARRSGSRATSSSSPAARPTRPSCCLQSASDKHPNGLANGSDQVGRNYMFHDSTAVLALSREENPTAFQKTLGLNDFYFGGGRLRVPARQHPDGRQVDGADVPRRATARHEARAGVDAGADGAPRDRLLALDRGPATAGEPRHRRAATASSRSPTRRRTWRPRSGSTRRSSRCSGSWT